MEKSQEIGGIHLYYKVVGQGPTILMLHGWGRGSDAYIQVMELLSQQGYQVIVPDLPGFGKTEPPKIAWGVDEYAQFAFQFVQALGLSRFFLLGHSFGGQVAVRFAADHAELVQGLILYGAAVIRREPTKKVKLLQTLARFGNTVFSVFPLSLVKYFIRKAFYRFLGVGSSAYAKGIMREVRNKIVRQDLSHLLPGISLPALILWGGKDMSTPTQDAYLIKEKIPQASLVVFPGASHLIHQEIPEQFVTNIVSFLSNKR